MVIGIVFFVYLALMVFIGFLFYNKTSNMSDFILGGRKLGTWLTAMSAQASDMSGWLLIGLPGTAYMVYTGTSEAIWTVIGLILGTYLNWLFVAKRLRLYTEKSGNPLTLSDYFENRFRDHSHFLRVSSAIFILIFFLVYTASGFSAGAKLFSTVFDVNYTVGLVIGALIILAYTTLGGFLAVCWTDTIQGLIMFFALMVVPIVALSEIGWTSGLTERLAAITPETLGFFPMDGNDINALLLASALGWGLGYFGQPHILTRFMAIDSPENIQKARIIAMVWVCVTLTAATMIGVIGRAYMPNLADPETIYMNMIDRMFPDIIAGILLTAILAAIMSTASSQLLVTASAVSQDLYATLFKKKKNDISLVWVSRFIVIVVSGIAIFIAMDPNSSVFGLVSNAWSGFGATFGPLILFSLFWRRMTRAGAIAGMLSGGVTVLFWLSQEGGIFDIYEIIPGFLISSLLIVVVSFMTKVPKEITNEFDAVKNMK